MSATFHHSTLDSDRIQKVLAALRQAGDRGLTTLELNQITGSTRSSSDCSELRYCGVDVYCSFEGTTGTGRRVYRYRLGVEKFQLTG